MQTNLGTEGEVESVECSSSVAVALCAGAPCFDNPHAAGRLNITCLCPVFPKGESGETVNLIPPDVGHFGGCDSYDYYTGGCAVQDNEGLKGAHEWKWDVAAVEAMSKIAVRETDTDICRAWFADDNH